jgi:Uma2 family endonuclease
MKVAIKVVEAPQPPPPVAKDQPWPAQGQWTYEDYLRLPDDGRRYEIIEGVLYVTNAPDFDHQFAVHQIAVALELWIRGRNGGIVLTAPFEVHLPNIAQPVQPDVLFISAARRPPSGSKLFEGAPDLIVEVLSPSTIRVDRTVKFNAYERAGVREYWLVDPKMQAIEVYVLTKGEFALLGQFGPNEVVQSAILEGFAAAVNTLFAAV